MHNKLLFAEQLRAIAVIFVVFAHYCGIFWYDPNMPTYINALPYSINQPTPFFISFFNSTNIPYINWGPLGVDIFFLISGFVIPISLSKYSRGSFAIRRFFRLYPTYFISFLFVILMLIISSKYFNNPFSIPYKDVLLHSIIGLREITNVNSIDLVVWTLEVELKFYILTVIFLPLFRDKSIFLFLIPIILAIILILLSILISYHSNVFIPIIYMFIGTSFYMHFTNSITSKQLISLIVILFTVFSMVYIVIGHNIYNSIYLSQIIFNGIYALIIVSTSYILRTKFKYNKLLGFIANISYPFYIIHSISGYIIMVILLDNGVSSLYIIPITLIILILVAYIIHKYIEMPSQKFGKNIAKLIR
jgi:peptidoglycan/LPS O-acetylase OafA/YrhL